ncbi:MAG TPA: hypothetical protein VI685_25100, partial [Candidatus Angelobacter sp.]
MSRQILSLIALFWAIPFTFAQNQPSPATPIQVNTCLLETDPNAYDGKLVELRGRIYVGKFDFVVDSICKPHGYGRVWLDFGGDVLSPEDFWGISSSLPKKKGVDIRVRGVRVSLVHDALMDRFMNDVVAIRLRKPNHDGCGSECLFYDVSATLRGRFFSGAKGGFGLEECCHLLVIEKVVDLSSRRTTVPAGGEFECTRDRWQPTEEELKALSAIPGCSLRANFNNCYVVLARHWGETIKPEGGLKSQGPWMSRDMMLSYKFGGGFISGRDQKIQMTPSSSVVREVCHARSTPAPRTDHVYCDFSRLYDLRGQNAGPALPKGNEPLRSSDMAQVAGLAVQDLGRLWKPATS